MGNEGERCAFAVGRGGFPVAMVLVGFFGLFTAHSSTPTPVFLTSREETQTMVQAKLRPKLRPPQTLHALGEGETQTMV